MGLPGGSDGEESACSARDLVASLGWADPLEKGRATHSSLLAWRIPWTEEPGGLQSMGSQTVGHDWVTNQHGWSCELAGGTQRLPPAHSQKPLVRAVRFISSKHLRKSLIDD